MDLFERVHDHVAPSHRNAYRPYLLRRSWLLGLLVVSLAAEALLLSSFLRGGVEPVPAAVVHSDIVALTNGERAQLSLGTLAESAVLSAAAQAKAEDMAAKGYFSHVGPDGTQPWAWFESSGYDYRYAGENLAVRFSESSEVVTAWMASPTHRANIVKTNYTEIGIGIAEGMYKGAPATFVVQFFGTPAGTATAAAPAVQPAVAAPEEADPEPAAPLPVEVAGAEDAAAAAAPAAPAPELIRESNASAQTAARQFWRALAEPKTASMLVLGSVAALLALALALTFFMHLQIQPTMLLAPGAVVAAIALTLVTFNNRFVLPAESQAAAAAAAAPLALEIGHGQAVERF